MGLLSKYKLDQKHIKYGADSDAQKRIPLPNMQSGNGSAAQNFRKTKGESQKIHILQAIDHQHSHNRKGEHLAQIFNNGRDCLLGSKNQKGR